MVGRFESSVVVGGLGEVGAMFVRMLRGGGRVVVADSAVRAAGPDVLPADGCSPGPALCRALAAADAVVVALPEVAGLRAVPALAAAMRPGALLADTLSVKSGVVPALAAAARRHGLSAVSLNPMFAPGLGPRGRSVAVVEVQAGDGVERMRALLAAHGARLVALSAAQHDELTAATQVATHASVLAFGQALRRLGADPAMLIAAAPPPHREMLGLLARVVSGAPEVYRDIQHGNPGAPAVRAALADALAEIGEAAGEPDRFAELTGALADWLGPYRDELAAECAARFAVAQPWPAA